MDHEMHPPIVVGTYYGHRYTVDEIRNAFPTNLNQTGSNKTSPILVSSTQNLGSSIEYDGLVGKIADEISHSHHELWCGNWENAIQASGEIGYPSKSEADLALVGRIVRALKSSDIDDNLIENCAEEIFNMSGLAESEKWKNRPDYRTRTIQKATLTSLASPTQAHTAGLILQSHGDIRNAKAFASLSRGLVVYLINRDKWMRWENNKWHLCEKNEHVALAKHVANEILEAAVSIYTKDQEQGAKYVKAAINAHSLPRISAMLELAVDEPGMSATDAELDSDPYLLGVQNGVVDLRTGQLLVNAPDFFITRYCNADFSDNPTCPHWLKFLDEIFVSDIDTIESVQRLLGLTLLGLSDQEILVICYGFGSNGKSVFSNIVHKIMGGYSVTAPPSLLTLRKQDDNGPRNDLAALAGSRYVSINELQAGEKLDEQVVKMLAGREPISARFLHREFFEFSPVFTPWLRTNHKPIITGSDDGIWRRLVLIPFLRKFAPGNQNPNLERELLEERDGILMWMIQGAVEYLKDHQIKLSPQMRKEVNSYRKDSDLLGEFLDDHVIADPNGKVNQINLYRDYKEWCADSGLRALSKKSFTQRMAERNYPESKSGNDRFYLGIKRVSHMSGMSQGGVDGISSVSGNSSQEDLLGEKPLNSSTSCPTCPDQTETTETKDA